MIEIKVAVAYGETVPVPSGRDSRGNEIITYKKYNLSIELESSLPKGEKFSEAFKEKAQFLHNLLEKTIHEEEDRDGFKRG